ncbi:hypothetical protein IWX75_002716 [Arthrobacter sp. CAN_A6]
MTHAPQFVSDQACFQHGASGHAGALSMPTSEFDESVARYERTVR